MTGSALNTKERDAFREFEIELEHIGADIDFEIANAVQWVKHWIAAAEGDPDELGVKISNRLEDYLSESLEDIRWCLNPATRAVMKALRAAP